MKIRLVIDPQWKYGWYINKNNNPDWGMWDMYVGMQKFFGMPVNVWNSFTKIIQGQTVVKVRATHNQEDTPIC